MKKLVEGACEKVMYKADYNLRRKLIFRARLFHHFSLKKKSLFIEKINQFQKYVVFV